MTGQDVHEHESVLIQFLVHPNTHSPIGEDHGHHSVSPVLLNPIGITSRYLLSLKQTLYSVREAS